MNLTVREAAAGDLADLADISRNTWEGHDYLEKVSPEWIRDSGFIVGETEGRVIACGKISKMPGDVAWLEGLRVHPDYRGRGYGRAMSERILGFARGKVRRKEFSCIEFSTYINNVESRTIAEEQGFRIVELFHVVGLEEPSGRAVDIQVREVAPDAEDFSIYPGHSPCGWKYIRTSSIDSIGWMRKNAKFWQAETGARFLSSNRGFEFSPLASSLKDPEGFVHAALSLAAANEMDYAEMMIHDSHRVIIDSAVRSGFTYWEEPGIANIPVYRFFPADRG